MPDTEPDRTIRLYGTVSEENGRLLLTIPLPQMETAEGRVLFADNWTTEVANRGDRAAVLDKTMVPKIVNYYESTRLRGFSWVHSIKESANYTNTLKTPKQFSMSATPPGTRSRRSR